MLTRGRAKYLYHLWLNYDEEVKELEEEKKRFYEKMYYGVGFNYSERVQGSGNSAENKLIRNLEKIEGIELELTQMMLDKFQVDRILIKSDVKYKEFIYHLKNKEEIFDFDKYKLRTARQQFIKNIMEKFEEEEY